MADRRAELERKKQKLAQIKEEKEKRRRELQANRERDQGLASQGLFNQMDDSNRDLRLETDQLLTSLGFTSTSETKVGDKPVISSTNSADKPPNLLAIQQQESPFQQKSVNRVVNLTSVINIHETNIPPKENVTYTKETQTSQSGSDRDAQPLDYYVLTYDDIPDGEDGEGSSLPYGTPPPSYHTTHHHKVLRQASDRGLPVVEMVKPATTTQETIVEVKKESETKIRREFNEDEKKQIVISNEFQKFFDRATRVVERALYCNEPTDIFIDYSGTKEDVDGDDKQGASLIFNRVFFDERWSKNRTVTCFDWSTLYPELLLASYNNNEEAPNDPDGVCIVWNMKFKKTTPEYVFHSQSAVVSACFAKFHPNLIVGGTYSGQIVLWDNRSNKRTPVQRSPLSASSHTHPIYCINVLGTQNAHNLITVSTDGKLCSWNLDMLSSPQDVMELSQQKPDRFVDVSSISFPLGDCNKFIVGSQEGAVYYGCRHGSKAGISGGLRAHDGPITRVDCHRVQTDIDFSHLFLTSSFDWTVKLWSTAESKPLHSFENKDIVYDVRWSTSHPGVFATADKMGKIDLWNLVQDPEQPMASAIVNDSPVLNQLLFSPSGHQIVTGDEFGKIWVYDIGEQLIAQKTKDANNLRHNLQYLKSTCQQANDSSVKVKLIETMSSHMSHLCLPLLPVELYYEYQNSQFASKRCVNIF